MAYQIKAPKGATKKKKIVGRGQGSHGTTAGRGSKGQNSRAGGGVRPGFEGGQMPLFRRIARRGFSNYPFKKEYVIINLDQIERKYAEGETVSLATLKEKGLVKGKRDMVKILGNADLSKKLVFEITVISKGAKEKILKAGGTVPETEAADGAAEDKE